MDIEKLAEFAGKIAVLEAQVAAQERLIIALAMALSKSQRLDLLEMTTAQQLNAMATGDVSAAKLMVPTVERIKAFFGEDLQASLQESLIVLHSETLLHAQTPAQHKGALQSWLEIATPEELEQDAAERLSPLLDAAAAAKQKRKPKAKKKPDAN